MCWKLCINNTYHWPKRCYSELYFYSTTHFLFIVALFTLFGPFQALQSSLDGQNANSLASNQALFSAFFLQGSLSRASLSGIVILVAWAFWEDTVQCLSHRHFNLHRVEVSGFKSSRSRPGTFPAWFMMYNHIHFTEGSPSVSCLIIPQFASITTLLQIQKPRCADAW